MLDTALGIWHKEKNTDMMLALRNFIHVGESQMVNGSHNKCVNYRRFKKVMRPTKMQSRAGKRGSSGPGVGAGFFTQWCRQAGLPKEVGFGAGNPWRRGSKCAGGQNAAVPRRKGVGGSGRW